VLRRAAGVGLVLALLAASHVAHAGGLTGTITDADSGAPLEGATVAVSTPAGVALTTVTTDAGGRYSLEVRAGGAVVVRASARGYQPRFFGGDRFRGQALTVSRSGELANANVALPRAAEITGRVLRRDGAPLFPGYVVLNPVGEYRYNFNVPTGEDGSYRFDDVPAGPYYMNAMAYDAVARQLVGPGWYWPGTEDMNAREPMTLTLGVPAQIDLRMEAEAREPSWVGKVTDAQGRPLVGVQLMILKVVERDGREDTEHVSVRRTDARGRCRLSQLPAGRYRVSTTDVPAPHAPWRNPDPAARGAARYARHFELRPDRDEAVSEFRLRVGRTARIQLRGESGQPLPDGAGASIALWHAGDQPFGGDGFFARSRATETPGELEVRGLLPAADYEVRVEGADARGRWCAATAAAKPTLTVPAEGDPSPLEVRVRRCS
jgi:5-hydroxyisourate hydrolase-like protein (transthyretin family)